MTLDDLGVRPERATQVQPHGYRAYRLAMRSDLALPELEPDPAETADVTIRLRAVPRPMPEPPAGTSFEFAADTQYLAWLRVGRFLIREARDIDIDPAPDAGEPLLRLPLLGPVMAVLLHFRGMLVLHASAIAMGGRSAVFLGDKQAGKSTTAAALVAAGHRLVADDVVAVDSAASGGPWIAPAFPQLKLERDAATSLIGDRAIALPPVLPGFEKRQHRLTERFSHSRVAPTRIYVLARGPQAAAIPLLPGDALGALIRFSYITRFGTRALNGAAVAMHFKRCAELVDAVKVCRLEVPTGLDRLGELVKLVEEDLA